MSKAIIFAGGDIGGFNKSDYLLEDFRIICVDKGYEFAKEHNLDIEIVIGDFDSLKEQYYKDLLDINILTFDKEKDKSDLELALDYAIDNNIEEIDIFGATGKRLDHTISNVNMLKPYTQKGLKLRLIDENNLISYINKSTEIKEETRYLSILPTNEECVFTLKGSKWELEEFKLEYGSTHTISNEFKDDIKIDIIKGDLFLILSKD